MNRRRINKRDSWLPSRVYRGRSAYEWHPKGGGNIKLLGFKRDENKMIVEDDDVINAVINAHKRALAGDYEIKDVQWLIKKYTDSIHFKSLSPKTQYLDELRVQNRVLPVFGKMMPKDIKKKHIRLYMDKVGIESTVSANRDHGFLSRLFNWAAEHGYMDTNPCQGVTKFKEAPRDRYIEDWEFDLVAAVADTTSSYKWIRYAMEFAYLCRMRIDEVLSLDENEHIRAEGVFVERGKGSANEITAWSPRLRAAYDGIKNLTKNYATTDSGKWIFKNEAGLKIANEAYKSAWQRVRKQAMTKGLEIDGEIVRLEKSYNFHDIKAKGVTDHETKESGHRSPKMKAVYDRKPSLVKPTR